jgi:hypothetical protein
MGFPMIPNPMNPIFMSFLLNNRFSLTVWYRSKVLTSAYKGSHVTRRTSDRAGTFSGVTLVARTSFACP